MNKWYCLVGIMHGSGYTGSPSGTGIAGLYDPVTGKKVAGSTEFKNKTTATHQRHRAYRYYATATSHLLYLARPRFEVFDGEAPGMGELLGRVPTDLYTWIKYGTSSAGAGMSDSPVGKTYIGIAYNQTSPTESNVASNYTWSLIKGDKGNTGATGATGSKGNTGATGATGAAGVAGSHGAGIYSLTLRNGVFPASSTASTEFRNAFGRNAVTGDHLTYRNAAGTVTATKRWNGSSWVAPTLLVNGDLLATGTITGREISAGLNMTVGTGHNVIKMSGTSTKYRIAVGNSNPDVAPFRLTPDGTIHAANGYFGGEVVAGKMIGSVATSGATSIPRIQFGISEPGVYKRMRRITVKRDPNKDQLIFIDIPDLVVKWTRSGSTFYPTWVGGPEYHALNGPTDDSVEYTIRLQGGETGPGARSIVTGYLAKEMVYERRAGNVYSDYYFMSHKTVRTIGPMYIKKASGSNGDSLVLDLEVKLMNEDGNAKHINSPTSSTPFIDVTGNLITKTFFAAAEHVVFSA